MAYLQDLGWPEHEDQSQFIIGTTGDPWKRPKEITMIMVHSEKNGMHFTRMDQDRAIALKEWLEKAIKEVWGE